MSRSRAFLRRLSKIFSALFSVKISLSGKSLGANSLCSARRLLSLNFMTWGVHTAMYRFINLTSLAVGFWRIYSICLWSSGLSESLDYQARDSSKRRTAGSLIEWNSLSSLSWIRKCACERQTALCQGDVIPHSKFVCKRNFLMKRTISSSFRMWFFASLIIMSKFCTLQHNFLVSLPPLNWLSDRRFLISLRKAR